MSWIDAAVLAIALTASSLLAYSLRILDARGAVASFILGAVILLAGDLEWFALMVAFTGMAFVATKLGRRRKMEFGTAEARDGERGAPNVLANGAAPAIAAAVVLVAQWSSLDLPPHAATWAYVTAVAAITADTLGSEIGGLSARARCILPPFAVRPPGTNGAVSWVGQAAAFVGPVVIAVISVPLLGLDWGFVWIPVVGGFLGSQLDSVLGATLENDARQPDRPLSKGDVNFIASFLPMVAVLGAFWLASL